MLTFHHIFGANSANCPPPSTSGWIRPWFHVVMLNKCIQIFLTCLPCKAKLATRANPDWKVCILRGQAEMAEVRLHGKFMVENIRLKTKYSLFIANCMAQVENCTGPVHSCCVRKILLAQYKLSSLGVNGITLKILGPQHKFKSATHHFDYAASLWKFVKIPSYCS